LGVTHLDTAKIYGDGRSEEIIGAYLKANPAARDRFVIATKGGIRTAPQRSVDNSPQYLRECLEGSLARLGVDHVALYYIHRRDHSFPIEAVMETLLGFMAEGKIGSIGFSEIAPSSLERACAVGPVMAVQSEYSLWTRQPELGMLQACARHGVAFVAFSPLARGVISREPFDPSKLADGDFRKPMPRFNAENFPRNEACIARFRVWCADNGWSPAAAAIAWTLAQGDHVIPIPGTRFAENLAEDAEAGTRVLTAQELAEVDTILPPGFAHGARYAEAMTNSVENYC
ncbi:MAG TPA: aldo/keto reductase, partial [Rhizobiaceae bacterium]|nr:aldo/keto reductase [Rhizobiaceae bacterium]